MPFNLAEQFINAVEEKLGARLPHSYRQAMMASNGGEVDAYDDVWNLHPILDNSDRKSRIALPGFQAEALKVVKVGLSA